MTKNKNYISKRKKEAINYSKGECVIFSDGLFKKSIANLYSPYYIYSLLLEELNARLKFINNYKEGDWKKYTIKNDNHLVYSLKDMFEDVKEELNNKVKEIGKKEWLEYMSYLSTGKIINLYDYLDNYFSLLNIFSVMRSSVDEEKQNEIVELAKEDFESKIQSYDSISFGSLEDEERQLEKFFQNGEVFTINLEVCSILIQNALTRDFKNYTTQKYGKDDKKSRYIEAYMSIDDLKELIEFVEIALKRPEMSIPLFEHLTFFYFENYDSFN